MKKVKREMSPLPKAKTKAASKKRIKTKDVSKKRKTRSYATTKTKTNAVSKRRRTAISDDTSIDPSLPTDPREFARYLEMEKDQIRSHYINTVNSLKKEKDELTDQFNHKLREAQQAKSNAEYERDKIKREFTFGISPCPFSKENIMEREKLKTEIKQNLAQQRIVEDPKLGDLVADKILMQSERDKVKKELAALIEHKNLIIIGRDKFKEERDQLKEKLENINNKDRMKLQKTALGRTCEKLKTQLKKLKETNKNLTDELKEVANQSKKFEEDLIWHAMYIRMCRFRHAEAEQWRGSIPTSKKGEDPDLYNWMLRQQYLYRRQFPHKINEEEEQVTEGNSNTHTTDPQRNKQITTTEANPDISQLPDKLNPYRLNLLNEINFEWYIPQTPEQKFQKDLQLFKMYKEKHGHLQVVPRKEPECIENYLVRKIKKIRANHDCYLEGKPPVYPHSYMNAERVEALNKIGFPFVRHAKKLNAWEERFQELQEYKERFGHCNVPQHWPENRSLGVWVNTNRKNYDRMITTGKKLTQILTEERIAKLDALGFQWKVRDRFFDKDWGKRFQELKDYKEKYADCSVPSHPWEENKLLSRWVVRVREEYRRYRKNKDKSRLTAQRIIDLEELGFSWQIQDASDDDSETDEENTSKNL